ncbi:hypothetical protein [Oceanospirillum sediminis]|uniref:Uncharacterized protein n=1 Tax=Oceanospirillum sediminis TaxID=2760088 RepID=A0A839IRU2_9GAMM|nr:hypothetical protein [Oceanospirillum sediminis]MBB1487262.1 hypothetical protein [Oceanospirillum sediminis]
MTDFIHNHINTIVIVLTLLVLPFYIQKMRQWYQASKKKNRRRRKRLR